ncbi:Hcp1 family type VI secretion system effector [Burkholderia ubonensis]|uniref:Hcp family type VI secretion system effector n=1 Tax=Burkholderia ubonensis TaxID=101571 RepID=UPI00075991C1|nr:type VI secretion system tube protein Hcp [Burkholderia ubonensis]KVP58482.1 Hcp1 family type VI secretion system effector [Burkholderia ubonensis]
MAVDMFMKLGDIKGEAQDETHKEEIELLAWHWGLEQSGTMHMGTGGGAGKVSVRDLSITKYTDKASPPIIAKCTKGDHIGKAILTVRKAGGDKPLEYYKITLEHVIVSSYETGSGGEERFIETVKLNFAKFHVEYQPQNAQGVKEGGVVDVKWDIPKNASQ